LLFLEKTDAIGFDLTAYEYFNVLGKTKQNIETMVAYDLNNSTIEC
jgi:hypothetical protein